METTTGRLLDGASPALQMLMRRQSSVGSGRGTAAAAPAPIRPSGPRVAIGITVAAGMELDTEASSTPVHGVGGLGGLNRFAAPVGAPYGMPTKVLTPSRTTPLTMPY